MPSIEVSEKTIELLNQLIANHRKKEANTPVFPNEIIKASLAFRFWIIEDEKLAAIIQKYMDTDEGRESWVGFVKKYNPLDPDDVNRELKTYWARKYSGAEA